MSLTRWFVIGISGITCSGKTTLAQRLKDKLTNSMLISQDNYFLPEDDPRHGHIPELNAHNWELISSLDMTKMHQDVLKIIQSTPVNCCSSNKHLDIRVLILEGFIIFKYKPIADLCNVKYFLTLTKQQCWERRKNRVYDPPDVPGYFDLVVWPEYEKYLEELKIDKIMQDVIRVIDGAANKEEIFTTIFNDISEKLLKF